MSQSIRLARINRGPAAYGQDFNRSFDRFVSEISGPSTMDEIFASMERPWLDENDDGQLAAEGLI